MTPEVRVLNTLEELEAAIEVRRAVFVDEQGGPVEDEPDEEDPTATHFALFYKGKIIGTARVVCRSPALCKIGRVCILAEFRSRGWGSLLMRGILEHAVAAGYSRAYIHAQTYALPFYERLGFAATGDVFEEGGIPHQRMEAEL